MAGPRLSRPAQVDLTIQVGSGRTTVAGRLGPKVWRVECGYWSGMRSVKNSTNSEAAGGSRLLRLTTT
jgi:hypothetical protein